MMRLILALCLGFGLAAAPGFAAAAPDKAPAQPAMLRPAVTVEGNTVTLGDLFIGIDDKADQVIAAAPAPGERVVLDYAWLGRVARAYHVNWQPTTRLDRVSLARASTVLDRGTLDGLVHEAMVRDGVSGELTLEYDLRMPDIHLPLDTAEPARLQQLQVDRRTLRFTGVLVAPANHPESRRYAISGRAVEQASLPALARRMMSGETIEERDLVWIKVRKDQVGAATLTDPMQLLGQAPRRVLQPNRPLTANDVEQPILVKRNAVVTVVYRHPGMELTAQAKAVVDGALGETVRVVNPTSNRQFDAVVTGRNAVTVGPAARARVAARQGY